MSPSMTRLLPTPVGTLRLSARGGAITRVEFAEHPRDVHGSVTASNPAVATLDDERNAAVLTTALAELAAYFSSGQCDFRVPLAPEGTPFQQRCWNALRRVPRGSTTTYARLARDLGCPDAARAVGLAMNRNPIMIMIPCHRVLGSNGSLTGYAGGLDVKRALLDHEANASESLFIRA